MSNSETAESVVIIPVNNVEKSVHNDEVTSDAQTEIPVDNVVDLPIRSSSRSTKAIPPKFLLDNYHTVNQVITSEPQNYSDAISCEKKLWSVFGCEKLFEAY